MKKQSRSKPHCYDYPRPALTVDIVLIYRKGSRLDVLLIKRAREPFKGLWALPGGFIDENESLEEAAARELFEETGLSQLSLEQVGAFGDPGRDPRGHTVSVVYGAVLDDRIKAQHGDDACDSVWHSARRPPALAFDHNRILRIALKRLLDLYKGAGTPR